MRFRFCGDLDCPDWLLAEISILSKMSSVKMKLLCGQVVGEILGGSIDYSKAAKLTADAKFEIADIKAAIAALNFIFSSATRYGVDGETVSNELQQLGLPREHANAVCKTYEDKQLQMKDVFKKESLRLSRLKSVDWRVDYAISSSLIDEVNEPEVQLKLVKTSECDSPAPDHKNDKEVAFTISGEQFRTLISDLKQAYKFVDDLS
eukprot:gene18645-20526_t